MRTYSYTTKLNSDIVVYIKQLQKISLKYAFNISELSMADQRGIVVKNKLLSEQYEDQMKEEVSQQLEEEQAHQTENYITLRLGPCKL